jgi:hypothetical protein
MAESGEMAERVVEGEGLLVNRGGSLQGAETAPVSSSGVFVLHPFE